jgi:predicted small metal-binding protein
MKEIKCRDVGQNCDFVCRGETVEEVLKKAAEHGLKSHGMTDLTQAVKDKIKNVIKDVKAA